MKKLMLLTVLLLIAIVGLSWVSAIPAGNYGWALPALDSPYYRYGAGYPTLYPSYGYAYSVAPYAYSYPVAQPVYTVPVRTVYPTVVTAVSTYPVHVIRYTTAYYAPMVYSPWVPISYYPWGTYYPSPYGW